MQSLSRSVCSFPQPGQSTASAADSDIVTRSIATAALSDLSKDLTTDKIAGGRIFGGEKKSL